MMLPDQNQSSVQLGQIDIYLATSPKITNMIGSNVYADCHGVYLPPITSTDFEQVSTGHFTISPALWRKKLLFFLSVLTFRKVYQSRNFEVTSLYTSPSYPKSFVHPQISQSRGVWGMSLEHFDMFCNCKVEMCY